MGAQITRTHVVIFIFVACCPKYQYSSESEGQMGECQTQNRSFSKWAIIF